MRERFLRCFRYVSATHAAIVALAVVFPGCQSLFLKKAETVIPVEFLVEVPPEPAHSVSVQAGSATVPPEPTPVNMAVDRAPPPKPAPTPAPAKVQRSPKRITRNPDAPSRPPPLSEEEIRRLLAEGARPSDRTVIPPSEDARCMAIIRDQLYAAWIQPSREEAGDAVAEVAIRLTSDGGILERRMLKGSGNASLDASVMKAIERVGRFPGLPASFVEKHQVVTIAFKLQPDGAGD
jgi:TonB family protein